MTSRKMVSDSKPFFLDGDNMPFLLLMAVSLIALVVGGPLVVMRFASNPVVWIVATILVVWHAYMIRFVYRAHRASKG